VGTERIMKKRIGSDLKGMLLRALFGRWRGGPVEDSYSILLPMPMDMPFLLRYALEGLRNLDTSSCKQVLVIPDGWGDDEGRGLRRIVESSDDPRVELVDLRPSARVFIHRMKKSVLGAANSCHWAMIFEGIDHSRCAYSFLHDADAFVIDADGLERQYRECRDREMFTLGVQARWDPFFEKLGYTIPGTWELMFSNRWARRRDPTSLKGRRRSSPHGENVFDNMLYPQYLDFPTGKVGVMDAPPRFVHFSGAVTTYRYFRYQPSRTVVDEFFRLLALSLLEALLPDADGGRALPTVEELARGLTDPDAPVTYRSDVADHEYPIFRGLIDDLCESPLMRGDRAETIQRALRPFDEHFEKRMAEIGSAPPPAFKFRTHGLG
jgi:hypothetical protein